MAMEYLYWCIVTNMGILADTQTCQGIADEWEPCTPALFESTDTLMYNLVTNPVNKLPQLAPDGNYCPENVRIGEDIFPETFLLLSAYPNPFNPSTMIEYALPQDSKVHLVIYDILGRHVKTLVRQTQAPGYKSVRWNGRNDMGQQVSAGMYFYRIQAGSFSKVQKMVLLK
jgi:hypothetical protein